MARILIVDDRSINREFLAALLGAVGHDVVEAADGREALELARAQRPELVITDLMMPVMDGLELSDRLHADAATTTIPVIFYTATYRVHEAREMARSHHATDVLPKPSEPQVILAAIERVLGPPPAAAANRASPSPRATGTVGGLPMLQQRLHLALDARHARGDPHSVEAVHALSLRLAAVLELGLTLGGEHDPGRLLQLFCHAAQDILGVRHAGVLIAGRSDDRIVACSAAGLEAEAAAALAAADLHAGFLAEVLAATEPRARTGLGGDAASVGLPASHPPVDAVLAAPLRSPAGARGVLYFTDKLNGAPFGEEDEQFAATLAAQLALAYGNLSLLDESLRQAGELRLEMVERERVANELRDSEARYRQLFDASPLPMWVFDLETLAFLAVNDAAVVHYGYAREDFLAMSILDIRPEGERERAIGEVARIRRGVATGGKSIWRHVKRDGTGIEVEISGHRLQLQGRDARLVLANDVTERLEQERKIARLSRIRAVTAGISSAMLRQGEREALLREACQVAATAGVFPVSWVTMPDPASGQYGLKAWHSEDPRASEMIASLRDAVATEDLPSVRAARTRRPVVVNDVASDQGLAPVRERALALGYHSVAAFPLLSGERVDAVWLMLAAERDFFDSEEVALLAELAEDLSYALGHIEQAERLDHLAYYDALTELPNARLFGDRLDQFVHAARENRGKVKVLVLDLEHFTRINETLGRAAGDEVLRKVAARLGSALREPYTLGRIAADTFAIASPRIEGTALVALRDRVLGALAEPFALDGDEVHVSAQAGIAIFPDDAGDGNSLFKAAEAALKQAKSSGERYAYYSSEMNARIAQRAALERELRRAVELGQFELHYQARVDLLSGAVTGAEALIRWRHPERGLLPPADFVALAEETGLIVPIGNWVIDAACAQLAAWKAAGVALVPVAVNLSSVQFEQGDLLGSVAGALARHALDPRLLELELTESAVMRDPPAAARMLRSLRTLGVGLALDDFGTGYSSLAHLKRFPFNAVKIDRSFITDLTTNAEDAAIATAIIAMAHRLELKVVAEGVEREGQLNYLRAQGCDEMQGHLFAEAVPAAEFERQLEAGRRLPVPVAAGDERTLLLVDDEQGVRNALFRALRRDGYRILMASGPTEAFELLAVNRVQVIVSDQRMPEMSGTEFLNTVKQLYPDTLRIILSGYTDLEVVTDSVNRGAVFKFLTKPWDDDLLREQVRDAFRRYQPAA